MLYEFSKDVQRMLADRHFPARVVFGPERGTRFSFAQSVVFEHDEAGDKLSAPTGAKRNPRHVRNRLIGAKATLYARSSLPGAHRGDHERECEKLVDAVTSVMYEWGVLARTGDLPISSAKYVAPKNADGSDVPPEVWPGVAYEIMFALPRGVYDRTYVAEENAGAAAPTGVASGVSNVTIASAPGVDPATGCGGT